MANATFYKTSKRHNSTLQPGGSGVAIDVQLKNGSDIIAPVFLLSMTSLPDYSMMVFEGRTYFITGISSVRDNLWEISAEVDVLATYKSNILGTLAHILYTSAQNTEIIDPRIPVETSATIESSSAAFASGLMTAQGKNAVSVVGRDSTYTFILTDAQVRELMTSTSFNNFFLSADAWLPVDTLYTQADSYGDPADSVEGLRNLGKWFKALIESIKQNTQLAISGADVLACIKSAIWYPWDIVGDGTPQKICLGKYETDIVASPVVNKIRGGSATVSIPWQADDWRRNAPYHQIYLYIPFVGVVQLSNSDLIDKDSIRVGWALNKLTGDINIEVTAGSEIIGTYAAQTGVSIPIGASNITPNQVGNAIAAGASAIGSAVTGNLAAAAALASHSINAIQPQITNIGGASGGAGSGLDLDVICYTVYHDTVTDPANLRQTIGEPYDKSGVIGNFSGYVKTQGASVSGSMTDTERSRINMLLDGGVYIE